MMTIQEKQEEMRLTLLNTEHLWQRLEKLVQWSVRRVDEYLYVNLLANKELRTLIRATQSEYNSYCSKSDKVHFAKGELHSMKKYFADIVIEEANEQLPWWKQLIKVDSTWTTRTSNTKNT